MAEKELCFCIEGKELYLDRRLVDYEGVPIFFLCRNTEGYCAVLCTDIKVFRYIVVPVAELDMHHLLQGVLPMRDVFTKSRSYWEIITGEEAALDNVTKHGVEELDCSVLPERGAVFQEYQSQ